MAPSPPAMPLFVPTARGDKASRIASLHDMHMSAIIGTCSQQSEVLQPVCAIPECCEFQLELNICQVDLASFLSRREQNVCSCSEEAQLSLLHQQGKLGLKEGDGVILPTWQHTAVDCASNGSTSLTCCRKGPGPVL